MDSTHSTDVYDFFLITILVLDDLDEGMPVLDYMEDAVVIRQVLMKGVEILIQMPRIDKIRLGKQSGGFRGDSKFT